MARIYFRGFVCDEDSQHQAASFARHAAVFTLADIGITVGRGTPDKHVIDHAREAGCIVVTGNRSDFRHEMESASTRCNGQHCHCGGGMITVQSGMPSFPFLHVTRTMKLGDQDLTWGDVFACNLHVAVDRTGFQVLRLPLCEWFYRDHADCPDCDRLKIRPPDDTAQ